MKTDISTIQEITVQAYELGLYRMLLNDADMSRDDVFATLRAMADEFQDIEKEHAGEPDWFYYDEIDRFIERKKKAFKADAITLERQIAEAVVANGEREETPGSFRVWLGNLNGVCDVAGHTDALSLLVDKDGMLNVQVNTPDDSSTLFVGLGQFSDETVAEMLRQALDFRTSWR